MPDEEKIGVNMDGSIPFYQSLIGKGTTMEILLFGLIKVLAFEKGYCWASNDYMAKALGSTKQSIAVLLSNIAKKGWVEVKMDEKNQRVGILVKLSFEPVIKEGVKSSLKGGLMSIKGGVKCGLNIYKKKDIKEDNITNKLVIGETPNEKVMSQTYGKEEINEVLDLWQKYIGYPLKDSKYNRYAVNNFLRAKDKGVEWVKKMLALLKEAQKDKYSGIHIANYVDLQRDYEKLLAWGSAKYQQRQEESSIIGDIPF